MKLSISVLALTILTSSCQNALDLASQISGGKSSTTLDKSISVALSADRLTHYSAENIQLTANVTNPSNANLTYTWFVDSANVSSGPYLQTVYVSHYTTSSTSTSIYVQVSNGTNMAISNTVTVQITPYTGSDAATLVINHTSSTNLHQLFLTPQHAMDRLIGNNLLPAPPLVQGQSITLTNLIPTAYFISGTNVSGVSTSGLGVFLVSGMNTQQF